MILWFVCCECAVAAAGDYYVICLILRRVESCLKTLVDYLIHLCPYMVVTCDCDCSYSEPP